MDFESKRPLLLSSIPPFPPSRLPFSQFTSLYHTKRTAAQKGERRRDTKQGRFRLTVTPPLSCFGRLSLPPSFSLFAGPSALPFSSSWNIACSPLLFLIRLPAAAAEQTGLSLSIPAIPLFHFRSLSEARHIFAFFSLPFLDPISSGERAADVANPPSSSAAAIGASAAQRPKLGPSLSYNSSPAVRKCPPSPQGHKLAVCPPPPPLPSLLCRLEKPPPYPSAFSKLGGRWNHPRKGCVYHHSTVYSPIHPFFMLRRCTVCAVL